MRTEGWTRFVLLLTCLAGLGGYAAFLLADRPVPAPVHAPGSFGLGVAERTDPARFRLVDDIKLAVRGLETRTAAIELAVTARAEDLTRPVAGAVVLALPAGAQVDEVRADIYPPGTEDIVGADPVTVTATVDSSLLTTAHPGPATVGMLAGQPVIASSGEAGAGTRPVRFLQVPVPAEPGTVTLRVRLRAPATMFSWRGRAGERGFAVDLGATDPPAPATRPLADFADPQSPATLLVTLDYHVLITEVEVVAVPPVTRSHYREVSWAEDVTEDSRLRIDGSLVDVPDRFWLGQLDNLALLLLGTLVAAVLHRWSAR